MGELWAGVASDTEYLNTSRLLDVQEEFAVKDRVNGVVVPFIVTLDKGYRSTIVAWRKGKQLVLQPDFAKSDRKFRGDETLSSAAIATDRGANERAVRLSKISGFIKRGGRVNSDLWRLKILG